MKTKFNIRIPVYLWCFLLLSCTDIYLKSGVKAVYALFPFLAINLFIGKKINCSKQNAFLVLWYLSYFLAVGNIVSTSDFIAILIGQAVLIVVFFYFQNIDCMQELDKIEKWFQMFLYLMVYVGLIQLLLYYLIGSSWGISHTDHGVGLPRMRGLSAEPDWYGLICAIAFVYMFFNRIEKQRFFSDKKDLITLIISGVMLILSLTRAAWVGFASSAVLFLIFFNIKKTRIIKRKILKKILLILPLIIFLIVCMAISRNPIFLKIVTRLNPTLWLSTASDGGAAGSRLMSITIMLDYFFRHPFVGNGVGGMGKLSVDAEVLAHYGFFTPINNGRGSANLLINCLFDTGIIGTFFFVLFVYFTYKNLWYAFKKTNSLQAVKYILIITVFLMDFQFNNGIRLSYVWVILGLASNYAKFYMNIK